MTLSLKESATIGEIANLFYDFLPGCGNPNWRGHVSFKSVAKAVGVGQFWQPGSKRPMIAALLERTFDQKRGLFERLILEIVKEGIKYRQKRNNPIKPEEIETLNGLLLSIGFKYPDLWDPELKECLKIDAGERAMHFVAEKIKEDEQLATAQQERSRILNELEQEFFDLSNEQDRWMAGYALQKLLNKLFTLEGLGPKESFRVVGEEIDGSFELDHESYLVEVKWEKAPLPEGPLLTFRGKIEGKSSYTRGVFIAVNGISEQASTAIVQGKQPTFFVMDGYDLTMVLSDNTSLKQFLRQRRRLLAEKGLVTVPYRSLWTATEAVV